MKNISSVSPSGQVMIPKEIREELGLRPNDQVEVAVENGYATLHKVGRSLDEVAGSLPPLGMPIEAAIREAKDVRAKRSKPSIGPYIRTRIC